MPRSSKAQRQTTLVHGAAAGTPALARSLYRPAVHLAAYARRFVGRPIEPAKRHRLLGVARAPEVLGVPWEVASRARARRPDSGVRRHCA